MPDKRQLIDVQIIKWIKWVVLVWQIQSAQQFIADSSTRMLGRKFHAFREFSDQLHAWTASTGFVGAKVDVSNWITSPIQLSSPKLKCFFGGILVSPEFPLGLTLSSLVVIIHPRWKRISKGIEHMPNKRFDDGGYLRWLRPCTTWWSEQKQVSTRTNDDHVSGRVWADDVGTHPFKKNNRYEVPKIRWLYKIRMKPYAYMHCF